jgi:hypothetical protein
MLQKGDIWLIIVVMNIENKIYKHMEKLSNKNNKLCFTPKHFINIASNDAVKKALERLTKAKKIRRVARGIYDIPYESKLTGLMTPDITKVVEAIAQRDKLRVQPTGAQAANLLGLSEQVPARITYLTDGRRKEIKVGNVVIEFRPASPKDMSLSDSLIGLIVQALKYLGKEKIDDVIINKLKRLIRENPDEKIESKLDSVPIWVVELIKNRVIREANV